MKEWGAAGLSPRGLARGHHVLTASLVGNWRIPQGKMGGSMGDAPQTSLPAAKKFRGVENWRDFVRAGRLDIQTGEKGVGVAARAMRL